MLSGCQRAFWLILIRHSWAVHPGITLDDLTSGVEDGGGSCLLQREALRHAHYSHIDSNSSEASQAQANRTASARRDRNATIANTTTLTNKAERANATNPLELLAGVTQHTLPEDDLRFLAAADEGMSPAQMAQLQSDIGASVLASAVAGLRAEDTSMDVADSSAADAALALMKNATGDEAAVEGLRLLQNAIADDGPENAATPKNKVTLMIIEMFPVLWLPGLEHFYLGNIRLGCIKLGVCIFTLGIGGVVWGIVDFIAIIDNALKMQEAINVVGLHAKFESDGIRTAKVLAIVDILMIFVWIGGVWAVKKYLKYAQLARLTANATKNPNMGVSAPAAAALTKHGGS